MTGKCLVTGCALVDIERNRWIWGDLFIYGSVYVFDHKGCEWNYDEFNSHNRAVLAHDYFEKNNLIVVDRNNIEFNAPTINYINL